jgi:hypothetical protein
MRKKAQRTKLPLLAFEAESWLVEIKQRKPLSQGRRIERAPRAVAPKGLRVAKAARLEVNKSGVYWAGAVQRSYGAGELCR